MAIIDFAHREITVKLVYFGAPGAGSNTNVRVLYERLSDLDRSRLHHFGGDGSPDESWYFDYAPPQGGLITGFSMRFRVYSMPGAIANPVHRREVLDATDAVVFVADARPQREQANVDSMVALERVLGEQGISLPSLPLVLQVNRMDAPDARPPKQVVLDLNPFGFPVIPATAKEGKGVLDTHEQLTRMIVDRIRDHLAGNQTAISLTSTHLERRERDEDVIARHVAAIQAAEQQRASLPPGTPPGIAERLPEWATLDPGPKVELPFQPREFVGMRPVHVLDSRLDGDQIVLELVMERMSGGSARRLGVRLANRPADVEPLPRNTAPSSPPRITETVTSGLPERIELPTQLTDFPPVWYGVAGLAGGVLVGLLTGFLAFG